MGMLRGTEEKWDIAHLAW